MSSISKIHVKGKLYSLKNPSSTSWTKKEIAAASSIVTNGTNSCCYYNSTIMMATATLNLNLTTLPTASNAVLLTGLPKPKSAQYTALVDGHGRNIYGLINTNGQFVASFIPEATGWYCGSTSYPYTAV